MSRWRVAGVNHAGQTWWLARPLVALADQIEAVYPDPEAGDGTVASADHDAANPNSDHRPSPTTGVGVVRGFDCGESSEVETAELVASIVEARDPRMAYLIYEGQSWWSVPRNGYPAWAAQPYKGPNPHAGHFHLSTLRNPDVDRDGRPWKIGALMQLERTTTVDEGDKRLAADMARLRAEGIMSTHTQPGGVAFNDEIAHFLVPILDRLDALGELVELLQARDPGAPAKTIDVRLLGEIL